MHSHNVKMQRPRRDSNSRPPPWQGGALTNWATGPNMCTSCQMTKVLENILKNGPSGTRTQDRSVMSRLLWPTELKVHIMSVPIRNKADDRTRTDNLLITNQLLCQLSHIGKPRTLNKCLHKFNVKAVRKNLSVYSNSSKSNFLFQWLQRESNPCYRRERAMS